MIEAELTVRTLAPMALRATRAALQFAPGLRHIPGTALRGSLTEQYLQNGQPEDKIFHSLFLEEKVLFSDLHPVSPDENGKLPPGISRPLPATARACKRHKLRHPGSLTDSLLRLELAAVLDHRRPLDKEEWSRCPTCENDRDRLVGIYTSGSDFKSVDAYLRLSTGASINRATGTAEKEQLFSFDVLEEGQFFRGRLRFQDMSLLEDLKRLTPIGGTLRLGMGKSRGLGRLEVVNWQESRRTEKHLEQRWDQLNMAVRRLWRHFEAAEPEGEYFSLTLESSLIQRDPHLLWPQTGIPDPPELDLPADVEPRRCVLNTTVIQGWNAALGLSKADAPALGPGTVLLYRLGDTAQRTSVLGRLKQIENKGIGERRAEGFGRALVCDPFHFRWTLQEVGE
jgi:CRISPR-associated protein Csx10